MNKRREAPSVSGPANAHGDSSQDDGAEDRKLVALAQGGDRDAFRALFEKHRRRAFNVALGVLHNTDEAMDVVQESFMRAHRSLNGFEGTAQFSTWLHRIVMNQSIDQLRRRKRAKNVSYDDAMEHTHEDMPGTLADVAPSILRANPQKELQRAELREKLEQALALLSDKHRTVLLLREQDGMSYEEMAQSIGCSKGTIMSRLFHARRYMQKHLAEYLGEDVPHHHDGKDDDDEEAP